MEERELKLTEAIKRLPERPLWWVDPVFQPLEDISKIPKEDWTAAIGSQLAASVIELPIQYFATTLGSKVANGVLGLGTIGLASTGAVSGRGALETLVVGGHFLSEVLDPSPEKIKEVFMNLAELQEGIREGNPSQIISSLVKQRRRESEEEAAVPEEVEEVPVEEEEPSYVEEEELPFVEEEEVPAETLGEEKKRIGMVL